jgi:serine/threonine-protein kinase Chk2
MAPEIVKQDPYGRPVDIWAAGVSLYLCLSSTYPFDNEPHPTEHPLYSDDIRIRDKIKMGRYELPSPVWDNISGSAKNLIFNMLMVNSKKRYTIEQCLEHPWLTEKSETLSKYLKESNYEAEMGEPQRVESTMSE